MASPETSVATLRPDLGAAFEEFDLEAARKGYIGHRVFPVINVGKPSGNFGKIPIEQLLQQRETLRASGSNYNRGNFTFQSASYATQEHGAEEPIDDRERNMYADWLDVELIATNRAFNAVLMNAEARISAAVFNATTWTGAGLTTAITNEWDDAANATPISDVEAAVRKVYDASGLMPNALILNWRAYRNLRNVVSIIDRIKYSGFMDTRAGAITIAAMAQVFDLDMIIVAGGTYNAAKEGQAADPTVMWSDEYAMVAKIATTNDFREPCGDGSEIDGRVETYREEQTRSQIIRVRHETDEMVLYPEAGHLLSNVTT
jgi:hypothetical protein